MSENGSIPVLDSSPEWVEAVPRIERKVRLIGGMDGNLNAPLRALARRTAFLKQQLEKSIPEAPEDGKRYGRKNKAWDEIPEGGSTLWPLDLSGSVQNVPYPLNASLEKLQAGLGANALKFDVTENEQGGSFIIANRGDSSTQNYFLYPDGDFTVPSVTTFDLSIDMTITITATLPELGSAGTMGTDFPLLYFSLTAGTLSPQLVGVELRENYRTEPPSPTGSVKIGTGDIVYIEDFIHTGTNTIVIDVEHVDGDILISISVNGTDITQHTVSAVEAAFFVVNGCDTYIYGEHAANVGKEVSFSFSLEQAIVQIPEGAKVGDDFYVSNEEGGEFLGVTYNGVDENGNYEGGKFVSVDPVEVMPYIRSNGDGDGGSTTIVQRYNPSSTLYLMAPEDPTENQTLEIIINATVNEWYDEESENYETEAYYINFESSPSGGFETIDGSPISSLNVDYNRTFFLEFRYNLTTKKFTLVCGL